MKRNLLLTLVLAFTMFGSVSAQVIPNGDFESWTDDGTNIKLDDWIFSSGNMTRYTSVNVNTQQGQQTINPPSGQYFIGLKPVVQGSQAFPAAITAAFPTTERPKYFQGNIMYLVAGSTTPERFGLTVALTKWNTATQSRDIIGSFSNNLSSGQGNGTIFPFIKAQVEIVYTSTETPDSAFVQFFSFRGVTQINPNTILFLDKLEFTNTPATSGVEETTNATFNVGNYPNPFSNTTTIAYELKNAGQVSLKVYDISGREVQTLVNDKQGAGMHKVDFNGANLSEGVYIYQLRAGETISSGKMVISRQ